MSAKPFTLLFIFVTSGNGKIVDQEYSELAGGWLKLYKPDNWTNAGITCNIDDSTLASPVNAQLREAIKSFMTKKDSSVSTILTGVQGTSSGDYISIEGVNLKQMPVLLEEGKSDNSCVAWEHRSTTVRAVNCDDTLSFVCFKKKYSVKVAGCGTADSEYTYDSRSGSCYKFHQGGVNWDNAFEDCQHEGAHLTVINNQLESIVLQELYDKKKPKKSDDDRAFIGLRKNEGTWKTIQKDQTLKEAGYETWHRGEPNSSVPPEDCGSIFRDVTLNDENCSRQLPFICEKDPEILHE